MACLGVVACGQILLREETAATTVLSLCMGSFSSTTGLRKLSWLKSQISVSCDLCVCVTAFLK